MEAKVVEAKVVAVLRNELKATAATSVVLQVEMNGEEHAQG